MRVSESSRKGERERGKEEVASKGKEAKRTKKEVAK